MQPIAVAASNHESPGEIINDDYLAFADDIVPITFEDDLGFQRLLQMMYILDFSRLINISDAERLFDL